VSTGIHIEKSPKEKSYQKWERMGNFHKRCISQGSPGKPSSGHTDADIQKEVYDEQLGCEIWRLRSPTIHPLQVEELRKPVVQLQSKLESLRIKGSNDVSPV
jgi:hypothetical protein